MNAPLREPLAQDIPRRRGKLWTLLDMHSFPASTSFLAAEQLAYVLQVVEAKQNKHDIVSEDWIPSSLRSVRQNCESAGLLVSLNIVDMCLTILTSENGTNYQILQGQLNAMKEAMFAELRTVIVLRLDNDYSKYYSQKHLFGQDVETAFPSASLDIEEAGKCLALTRPTAAVFHVVRVMEVGLKALARVLGIPYAPSWESYITQIERKVGEKHHDKSDEWKRDEPFFRDILGDLQAIKIAWRNPTMHIVRHYNQDEAEDIFRCVRTFVKRLAGQTAQTVSGQSS